MPTLLITIISSKVASSLITGGVLGNLFQLHCNFVGLWLLYEEYSISGMTWLSLCLITFKSHVDGVQS
jgi:hypothetical protein